MTENALKYAKNLHKAEFVYAEAVKMLFDKDVIPLPQKDSFISRFNWDLTEKFQAINKHGGIIINSKSNMRTEVSKRITGILKAFLINQGWGHLKPSTAGAIKFSLNNDGVQYSFYVKTTQREDINKSEMRFIYLTPKTPVNASGYHLCLWFDYLVQETKSQREIIIKTIRIYDIANVPFQIKMEFSASPKVILANGELICGINYRINENVKRR